MFSSLDTSLNWGTSSLITPPAPTPHSSQSDNSSLILVRDRLESPGSFLLHYFLSRALSPSTKILFLAFGQSKAHYASVSKKLGTNFPAAESRGELEFLDGSSCVGSGGINKSDEPRDLNELLEQVISSFKSPPSTPTSKPHVIIDDLSILDYAGIHPTLVLSFILKLRDFVFSRNGTLVIRLHADEDASPSHTGMTGMVEHLSHYILRVDPLVSGSTQGIDGQISICRGALLRDKEFVPGCLLYKLADGGVHFFKKGFSAGII
ncbi:hypothetical protein DFS34DRAFT_364556 [Phlyctochytrium arcticum]|nr:hypothetical protein DFS34DRAFT_364556 [Phlyctochytrium arcticum]